MPMVNGFFEKIPSPFNGERKIYSTDGAGTTGFSRAKGGNWTPLSYHTQKLTQN